MRRDCDDDYRILQMLRLCMKPRERLRRRETEKLRETQRNREKLTHTLRLSERLRARATRAETATATARETQTQRQPKRASKRAKRTHTLADAQTHRQTHARPARGRANHSQPLRPTRLAAERGKRVEESNRRTHKRAHTRTDRQLSADAVWLPLQSAVCTLHFAVCSVQCCAERGCREQRARMLKRPNEATRLFVSFAQSHSALAASESNCSQVASQSLEPSRVESSRSYSVDCAESADCSVASERLTQMGRMRHRIGFLRTLPCPQSPVSSLQSVFAGYLASNNKPLDAQTSAQLAQIGSQANTLTLERSSSLAQGSPESWQVASLDCPCSSGARIRLGA